VVVGNAAAALEDAVAADAVEGMLLQRRRMLVQL
jgi:hypothetical protein